MRARRLLMLALGPLVLSSSFRVMAAPSASALHIRVDGVINPIKARYVRRALELAREQHDQFVLLSLNTPGGLVSSMQSIVADIENSPVPVVGFVEPKTAQATSAGAFVLLACDVAAMAPGTRVGAAHPVAEGKNLEGAMDQKATNSLVSLAKTLAAEHKRPTAYAESIVRESKSFTADEAKHAGAVEIIANDVHGLLEPLDGYRVTSVGQDFVFSTRRLAVSEFPLSASNRLLDVIADPTLASLLLTLGVLGILYELSSPGIGAAGIIGTICLVLALVALSTLPIQLGGVVLLLAGLMAIVVEVKSPSHGALALGGVFGLLLGALLLVDETGYFGAAQKLNVPVFLAFAVVVALCFMLFAGIAAKALRAPAQTGLEAMTGEQGAARTRVSALGGMVFVRGSRWQAVSDSVIEEGEPVVVDEVLTSPTRLRVRPTDKGAP